MSTRPNYRGLFRKLVIAFDVGTTYSGASYAILDPGLAPVIEGVTSFPGQLSTRGDSKIPSIICYDQTGQVRAVGSEATDEGFLDLAEEEDFITVEWFKLHMRPKHFPSSHVRDSDIPPLPLNKTAVDVFADFLRYLHDCTIDYIKKSKDPQFWSTVEENIDYVLTHPNGWEGLQQSQMRQAAIRAGLITPHDEESRLQFVTEGEASLHYCINKGIMNEIGPDGQGIIIVDAGGGTIDLSAYAKTAIGIEEVARTQCRLQGSVYVTRRAEAFLRDRLRDSKYGNEQDITHITSVFDKSTKHLFRDDSSVSYIRFGSARDKDPAVDIKGGQMKVSGETMKQFFAPSIQEIIEAIQEQKNESSTPISSVFLVGGFAASEWLFSNLQTTLTQMNLGLSRPDGFVNKAVADGAVSFYLDHCVSARVSRFTYGVECAVPYDQSNPEHRRRAHTTYVNPSGMRLVPGAFSPILPKGTRVEEEKEFKRQYHREAPSRAYLQTIPLEIVCYRGRQDDIRWLDSEPKMFSTLCMIEADLTGTGDCIVERVTTSGARYYQVQVDAILLFGLTELKAQVCWEHRGEEKRTLATVVYDQANEVH